jgi:hypothetical protein
MVRLLSLTAVLTLAGCSSAPPNPPVNTYPRSGEVMQAAVGSPMVSNRSTAVYVPSMVQRSRVNGYRTEVVYLGLLGSDPAGKSTIRVHFEEHRTKDGVEDPRPEYRAEVTLDLSQARVIEFRGWRIQVIDATESSIRYEVIGVPAP